MKKRTYRVEDGTTLGERLEVRTLSHQDALDYTGELLKVKGSSWASHFAGTPEEAVRLDQYFSAAMALQRERGLTSVHYAKGGQIDVGTFCTIDAKEADSVTVDGFAKHRPIYGSMGKLATKLRLSKFGLSPRVEKAYVIDIDVVVEHQAKGMGSALLHAALQAYPLRAEVVLEAVGKHDYTHEWFESLGLEENPELVLPLIERNGVVLEQVRYDNATVGNVLDNLNKRVQPID